MYFPSYWYMTVLADEAILALKQYRPLMLVLFGVVNSRKKTMRSPKKQIGERSAPRKNDFWGRGGTDNRQ